MSLIQENLGWMWVFYFFILMVRNHLFKKFFVKAQFAIGGFCKNLGIVTSDTILKVACGVALPQVV